MVVLGTTTAVVVVVAFGSTMVVVVEAALGSVVDVVVAMAGSIGTVVVGTLKPGTRGAGGTASVVVVAGTGGKRSANVVGRQAAWAGATATTDTKATQAKKSVVTRVLKDPQATRSAPQGKVG